MKHSSEIKDVAYFMRRLYDRGLTTTSGGNISLRKKDTIYITPSSLDKAILNKKQIVILDLNGKIISKQLKPSIEYSMHISIYKTNPEVKAIVHAHPLMASCFSAMNKSINCKLTAEAYAILKEPVLAKYALMGTTELATIVAESSLKSNCIILENHGVLTTGKTLLEAFDKMEVLEAAAKMTFITDIQQNKNELNSIQLKEIDKLMNRL